MPALNRVQLIGNLGKYSQIPLHTHREESVPFQPGQSTTAGNPRKAEPRNTLNGLTLKPGGSWVNLPAVPA